MTDAMAAMLDELMGKQRNTADKDQQQQKLQFDEPEVCKHALAGLCPYTLFSNTKSDLGADPRQPTAKRVFQSAVSVTAWLIY